MRLRLRGLGSMAVRKHGEARAARKHEAKLRDRQAQGDVHFDCRLKEIRD